MDMASKLFTFIFAVHERNQLMQHMHAIARGFIASENVSMEMPTPHPSIPSSMVGP